MHYVIKIVCPSRSRSLKSPRSSPWNLDLNNWTRFESVIETAKIAPSICNASCSHIDVTSIDAGDTQLVLVHKQILRPVVFGTKLGEQTRILVVACSNFQTVTTPLNGCCVET